VLRGGAVSIQNGAIALTLPPHSVRILKLTDTSLPEPSPGFEAHVPTTALAGDLAVFHSAAANADAPALDYRWEFGDGVSAEGADASHAYTLAGAYTVKLTATGLNGRTAQKQFPITVTGATPTGYDPAAKQR
jgi:chitodextrinase